jgi:hypothetical protein
MTRLIILTCALVLIFGIGMSFAVTDDMALIAKGGGGGGHGTSGKDSSNQAGPGHDTGSPGRESDRGETELNGERHHNGEAEIRGPEAEGEAEHAGEDEHNQRRK